MIYKSSSNHKGIERLSKTFCCVFDNSLPSVRWFFVSAIWTPPPYFGGSHIWLISSSPSTIQLSVGTKIVGLKFLFGHEIQRSTLQKFADLWDTKCSVTGLATLCSSPQCVFGFKFRFVLFGAPSMAGSKFKPPELSMSISKTNLNAHQVINILGVTIVNDA